MPGQTDIAWVNFDPWLGPITRIAVAAAFGQVPHVTVNALIDTGSTTTFFAPEVIQHIGAKSTGKSQKTYSISHAPAVWPEFVLALSLPFTSGIRRAINIPQLVTLASDLPFGTPRRPYHAVIGQDLLAHCRLIFDGPRKRFQLLEATPRETEGHSFTRGQCPVHLVRFGLPDDDANQLRLNGKPVPPPVDVPAMIDTGSSHSDVSETVIEKLGAVPIDDKAQVHYGAGRTPVELTQFNLAMSLAYTSGAGVLRSKKALFTVAPVSAGSSGTLYDALIGWNVLQNCWLVFDGPSGLFQILRAAR